jgi:hypothetical protein
MVNPLEMKEKSRIPLRPGFRRVVRTLGISAAIYSFLRLTFVGELLWSMLATPRRSEDFGTSTAKPAEEPLLDSE